MLEGKDIGDSEIMGATEIIGGANDRIQFKTTLPSGRELSSEFFPSDKRQQAVMSWVEVVRRQRVDDAQEVRARARRVAEEQRRGAIPQLVGPDGDVLSATPPPLDQSLLSGGTSPGFSIPAVPSSGNPTTAALTPQSLMQPLEFARQAIQALEIEETKLRMTIVQAMQRVSVIQQQKAQWSQILAMSGVDTNVGAVPVGPGATGGVSDPGTPAAQPAKRPRGRPRGSKSRSNIQSPEGTNSGT